VFLERVSLAVSQMMRDAGKSLVPLAESIEWWMIQIGMDSTNFEHMSKRLMVVAYLCCTAGNASHSDNGQT
jgi:hypothetical protein